ncbi:MAG: cyclic nucleotide-binding domain-containing protein [Deltaproteobacteria bacterium]|nr:cyclic nucleotide-binding domain-containing protein [Deltaproteobacteria bacterium]
MNFPAANPLLKRPPARGARALSVLIIDPSQESRMLMKTALRSVPFVQEVRDRQSTEDIEFTLADYPANVIILDHKPPEMNAFDAARSIRQFQVGQSVGLILMAPQVDMYMRQLASEANINTILPKPFDINGLEKALRDSQGRFSTNFRDTLDKVRRIPFFTGFTDQELVRLLKICQARKFSQGEFIFHEGEQGDRLYVLLSGQVNIVKNLGGREETLAQARSGDCFGEMAVVDAEPRSAAAVAVSDCMAMEVHSQIFNEPDDILALKLFRKIAILVTQKLRASNTRRS